MQRNRIHSNSFCIANTRMLQSNTNIMNIMNADTLYSIWDQQLNKMAFYLHGCILPVCDDILFSCKNVSKSAETSANLCIEKAK